MNATRCPMCGCTYDEGQSRSSCDVCPLHHGCHLLRCPNCGYEVPGPTRLTRWLSRWLGAGRPEARVSGLEP